jgi:opine dehydrogenase
MTHTITVIGGGNGAFAAAADLTIQGFKVALFDLPQFESTIADAAKLGGITLETLPSSGLAAGFAKIDTITTDIKKAVAHAELILVIVPSFAQEMVAQTCAPHLEDGQIILLTPGNFGGAIRFRQCLVNAGCTARVYVAEAETMMYACRKKDSTTIWVRGNKQCLPVAAFPAADTDHVLSRAAKIYPRFIKAANVLVTGLSNLNTILHLPVMLANISNADNKADVLIYHAGMTPGVGNIIDKMEEERIALKQVGLELRPMLDIIKGYYGYQGSAGNTIWEFMRTSPVFPTSKVPTSLNHRYLTEDIPFGAIPMMNLLSKAGLPNRTIGEVVDLLCIASGLDLYRNPRDLKSLGLDDLSMPELLEFVRSGRRAKSASGND